MIMAGAVSIYVVQLGMYVLGIVSFGIEAMPIAGWVFPGQSIAMASYAVILVVGFITMFGAAFVYVLRGIDCFSGWKGIAFVISLACYMTIFVNVFPWVFLWVATVIYDQE